MPHKHPVILRNDRYNGYRIIGFQQIHMARKSTCCVLLLCSSHVAGWNFDFPSDTERILWRVSSLSLFGITVAFWFFETIASCTRLGRWKTIYLYVVNKDGLQSHRRNMTRKQTLRPKRRMSDLPVLWEFVTITPMANLSSTV